MTVKELRQLLFDVEDQDAQISIPTQISYGSVVATKTIVAVEENGPETSTPEGFVRLSLG
jgi:hypothetical protein